MNVDVDKTISARELLVHIHHSWESEFMFPALVLGSSMFQHKIKCSDYVHSGVSLIDNNYYAHDSLSNL